LGEVCLAPFACLVWEKLWIDERWLSVEEITEYFGTSKYPVIESGASWGRIVLEHE
jgi:hypothetical protein